MPPDPPSLAYVYMHTYTPDSHVTPLLKVLATGLNIVSSKIPVAVAVHHGISTDVITSGRLYSLDWTTGLKSFICPVIAH